MEAFFGGARERQNLTSWPARRDFGLLLSLGFAGSTATMWPSLGFRVNSGFTKNRMLLLSVSGKSPPGSVGSSDSLFIHSGSGSGSCLEVGDAAGLPGAALGREAGPGAVCSRPARFAIRAPRYLTSSLPGCPQRRVSDKLGKTRGRFSFQSRGKGYSVLYLLVSGQ